MRLKSLICCFCGLLMAVQGWVPAAAAMSHTPASVHAAKHCAGCSDHQGKTAPGCCDAQCPDPAGCAGMVAIMPARIAPITPPAISVPAAYRQAGFAAPDPDSRLRPPTVLPG